MISAQIAQHTSFGLKTEFSKDKYRARKAAKFSKQFTVLEPTVFTVCDHLFNKDNQKVCGSVRLVSCSLTFRCATCGQTHFPR